MLYPLDTIKPQPPLNLMRERGVVGVAAKMVRVDNRFRNLIDALLGRTIIVEKVRWGSLCCAAASATSSRWTAC